MNKEKFPWALLLNDIHVNKDNIAEFQLNWGEALNICEERGITEIVIGGDLWTNRAAQTLPVLLAVRSAIIKATSKDIEVIIAEGNHDLIDQESLLGYSHIFTDYPKVTVVSDFIIEELEDGLALVTMSYFPENGGFLSLLEEVKNSVNPQNTILYIHEGINGALSKSTDDELPAEVFSDFRKVLVGHYHDRTQVKHNIFYIGASRQHNFGEDEEKGYTILYSNGDTEFIKNQVNTRYATIAITPDTIEDAKERIKELVNEGKKVKVKVDCNTDEASTIDKQSLIDMGVSKVEIKTETISVESASQALEIKYDKSGIKQEYANFCQKKEIVDVETGLKYLDKIN